MDGRGWTPWRRWKYRWERCGEPMLDRRGEGPAVDYNPNETVLVTVIEGETAKKN